MMTELLGVGFDAAFSGGLELVFEEVPVRYIWLTAPRAAKQAAGRPQDLRDLENLPF